MVRLFGGQAFGVFDPANPAKAKQALQKFLLPKRVVAMLPPEYGRGHALGALLRSWVSTRAAEIQLERDLAKRATSSR